MKRDVVNLLLAGLLLATCEVVATLARGQALFLSVGEQLLYALTVLTVACSSTLVLGTALRAASDARGFARVLRGLLALLSGVVACALAWQLTEGRRVHDVWWRTPLVVLVALFAASLAWPALQRLARLRAGGATSRRWLTLSMALGAVAVALSANVFPRGYPAFHVGLALLPLGALSASALLFPPWLDARFERRAPFVAALCVLLAPWLLSRVAHHPTVSFAVREKATWSARVMAPFVPASRPVASAAVRPQAERPSQEKGVDLRDRDVLLISVDALRADLLRAYGGANGRPARTPELDRLADESTVFLRAYTPAPHTSYALASLLTGKFVKPLIELGHQLGDPPTLPDRLRRYGYRTAAFYPPAIFFVDGKSFEPLQKRGFGFEYRKEMFASASERVAQLSTYLADAEPNRPLFVWVHLFEPHEPYDPPRDVAHDGSERGRYEAEVAVCDRAIAELVRLFRAARPRATVIVTADHGEEFGDHGGSFHGTSLYDEQVRIPLLWSSPGEVAAQRTSVPVELTDVGTTILSTAGIPRDAHMRGDDLSAVLAAREGAGPRFAFASVEGNHMVTDGAYKLICGASDAHCALFDLVQDPTEQQNRASLEPSRIAPLRAELDAFLSSISRNEAVTVSQGVSLPEVLARAKLGVSTRADALLPLLADARASVRSESARVLGERGDESALPALQRTRAHDDDDVVRREAAIATLLLGDAAASQDVLALLVEAAAAAPSPAGADDASTPRLPGAEPPRDQARARRAALALARIPRREALPVLRDLALDESATESERVRAVRALGGLGTELAVEPLIATLAVVRLREVSAHALAQVGGSRAIEALRRQLAEERYPPARGAEAAALHHLGDVQLTPLLRRFVGMESSLPHGVQLLAERGALTPSSRAGALLSDSRVRVGTWRCTSSDACVPEASAALVLPARGPVVRGPTRVTLWVLAASSAVLLVDGQRFVLSPSDDQVSLVRPASPAPARLSIACEGEVALRAVAVVSAVPEIPPPPPEPWEAAPDAGGVDSAPVR